MDYYTNPAYFGVWSKLMMPGPGAPPVEFALYGLLFAFITGWTFAWGYELIQKALPYRGLKKGESFCAVLFMVAGIPGALTNILLFNLPGLLVAWWLFFDNFLTYLAAGIFLERVYRK
jgi:hypothetical protein